MRDDSKSAGTYHGQPVESGRMLGKLGLFRGVTRTAMPELPRCEECGQPYTGIRCPHPFVEAR